MPTELGWSVFWAGRSSDETKCRAASSGRDALMVMVTCVVVKDKEPGVTVLGELKSGPPFLFLDMDMTTVRREFCAPINTMPVPPPNVVLIPCVQTPGPGGDGSISGVRLFSSMRSAIMASKPAMLRCPVQTKLRTYVKVAVLGKMECWERSL